jgi:hypothetical protein
MKKLLLIGIVAFVVSAGMGIGGRLLLFPPEPVDPTAADSTLATEAVDLADSGPHADDPADEADPQRDLHVDEQAEVPPPETPASQLPGGVEAAKALEEARQAEPADSGGDRISTEPEVTADAAERDTVTTPSEPDPTAAVDSSDVPAAPQEGSVDRTEQPAPKQVPEYKTLARILATMRPADAAKILAYLSDDEVEGILRSLRVRQIATLLSELPTERAAALGQRLVDTREEEES